MTGELDLDTADDLRAAVRHALDHALGQRTARTGDDRVVVDRVVVDLDAVTFCDSSGADALLAARADAAERGAVLQVANPHGVVRRVLDITGALQPLITV